MLIKVRLLNKCGPVVKVPAGCVNQQETKGISMANNGDFIPRPKMDATNYGTLVHGVIAADDYDPATLGLTDADVAELGDLVSANQNLLVEIEVLKAALMAKTKELSGPNGNHRRMVAKLRNIGNKARISNATNAELAMIGVRRKKTKPSRKAAPADAPELVLESALPGLIRLRTREMGSASPRARAANANGVQIAVVDAANPAADGEADHAPIKSASRSPVQLDTTGWPAKVRLYARWETQRKEFNPWSWPQVLTVL
jgi:hypothetical protein